MKIPQKLYAVHAQDKIRPEYSGIVWASGTWDYNDKATLFKSREMADKIAEEYRPRHIVTILEWSLVVPDNNL